MIDVTCFKWKPKYGPRAVNVLRRMVARNLPLPHRFTCITDDPEGLDPEVRVVPLWSTYGGVPNPWHPSKPSCYRRLRLFSDEARELIGERIVNFDLDIVITGDLTPLLDRPDDFVILGGFAMQPKVRVPFCRFNGSMMMVRAGTRREVWETFDPKTSPLLATRAMQRGSDQGWIAYCLAKDSRTKTWTSDDGVYSYLNHIVPSNGRLPPDARVVVFHGHVDPWTPQAQAAAPWIKEHWR